MAILEEEERKAMNDIEPRKGASTVMWNAGDPDDQD